MFLFWFVVCVVFVVWGLASVIQFFKVARSGRQTSLFSVALLRELPLSNALD